MSCLLSCERAGPGSGATCTPKRLVSVMRLFHLAFAKNRELWREPMFLLGCGAWARPLLCNVVKA